MIFWKYYLIYRLIYGQGRDVAWTNAELDSRLAFNRNYRSH